MNTPERFPRFYDVLNQARQLEASVTIRTRHPGALYDGYVEEIVLDRQAGSTVTVALEPGRDGRVATVALDAIEAVETRR